jgi:hypothetical protein
MSANQNTTSNNGNGVNSMSTTSTVSPAKSDMQDKTTQEKISSMGNQGKDLIKKGLHNTGDFIEDIGNRIEQSGFKKVGQAIEKLGDKIEHIGS